jgi:nitroimidazol reductase NimA-like FMN-containing flavoprotein (pyridoxamine 5'-phosphate oxidase superfamily)
MFPEMRRKQQQLSEMECKKILEDGTYGVLALSGDGGYPYSLPICYCYQDGFIWFHCARSGQKLESIRRCEKASFCVVGAANVIPERFTICYSSVIAFGKLIIVDGAEERKNAADAIMQKYAPDSTPDAREAEWLRTEKALCIFRMELAHMTGKEAVELSRARQNNNVGKGG